jgi:hypothetical protein
MAILSPTPKFSATFVDSNGFTKPAVGYKLYTYTAGTTTPKASYTDITLGSSNTNPVVLDARGEASVWLNGSYKLVLKTDTDSTIWTVDEVRDLTSDGIFVNATLNGTLTISSTAVTWSGNPTHSGNHTFTNNVTVKGNTQLGDQSTDTLRIDPNTVTWTNNPTHSGNHTWSGTQTFSGASTFGSTVTLPSGQLIPGVYSPTMTAVANVDSTSCVELMYTRIGSNVIVSGEITVDPTSAASVKTTVGISLPVASAFANTRNCGGHGGAEGALGQSGSIIADATNDRAEYSFIATSNASMPHYVIFQYKII